MEKSNPPNYYSEDRGYQQPQQQYGYGGPQQSGYPQQGYPPQPAYPPHAAYPPGQHQQQPQVVYVQQQKESSGPGVGTGICAGLAICCCLDMLF
ncbi:hypothetical protein BB558_006182 [Smittium angustum]|uniref:Cysteine-rich transmembrane domain-containing protein n=1 Tax=Smittium angustum TaxID=133377 RepID=A0A2U1IYK0_SMIAN|nr:hypothetical protein BB558_006182 [Smittium angustum]